MKEELYEQEHYYPYLEMDDDDVFDDDTLDPADVDPSIPLFTTDLKPRPKTPETTDLASLIEGQIALLTTPCSISVR